MNEHQIRCSQEPCFCSYTILQKLIKEYVLIQHSINKWNSEKTRYNPQAITIR